MLFAGVICPIIFESIPMFPFSAIAMDTAEIACGVS